MSNDIKKTVYGPVKSWRFGMSLGIDPIFLTSTCSFNCIYCQLGNIQNITTEVKEYVSTDKVIIDYQDFLKTNVKHDTITYSGSGEPTLASNLGDMIKRIRELSPNVSQSILTNGTEIHHQKVRDNLMGLDKVIFKLDAANNEILQKINRPADGVTLEKIIDGFKTLKKDYKGQLEIQSMFMPTNQKQLVEFTKLVKELSPSVIQLNTPKRPYPLEWHRENRGKHEEGRDYKTVTLKTIDREESYTIEQYIRDHAGIEVLSIYQ
jgi:wyosine [tRNA(Phe)-imidazoG37] synthetase (radical SAM superfamily)